MLCLGYFGNVGIDAMVYRSENGPQLHPIVEINARKTMGFAALELQKRHFPNKTITLSFHAGGKRHFSINVGDMTVLKIQGGIALEGNVKASGAKNAITKLLVASLFR